MFMSLLRLLLLFAVFIALLRHVCAAGIDIDLNQPSYPGEEIPTTEMMPANDVINSPTKDGKTATKKRKKPNRNREKVNEANRRYYYEKKAKPNEYAKYLKRKANNKAQRFKNMSEEKKLNERLQRNIHNKAYFDRRKAKDPNYTRNDARTQLRNRVRDGTATVEDKERYRNLLEKNKASVQKYQLAQKAKKLDENPSLGEKERPTKRRRIQNPNNDKSRKSR